MKGKPVKYTKKRITLDSLATMTARGFSDVEERLGLRMDDGFKNIRHEMGTLREEVRSGFSEIRDSIQEIKDVLVPMARTMLVMQSEIEDLKERVARLEEYAGIKKE